MQKKTEQFLKLHTDILNSDVIDMYGKYIYIYVLQNTDLTGYCRRSYYAISYATGISVSKVKESVKTLVTEGFLKKISSKNENGSYDVNRYFVADTEELWSLPVRADRQAFLDKCFNSFISGTKDGVSAVCTSVRPFVRVSYDLLNNNLLSIKEKLMYICLSAFKNRKTGFCFPSLKTLAGKLRVCKTTASKYINLLTSKGIIKKRSFYNSSTGARSSSRYEFCALPEIPPLAPPKPPKEPDKQNNRQHFKDCKEPPENWQINIKPDEVPPDEAFGEPWTDEGVREYFNYPDILTLGAESGISQKEIDYTLDIIRHNLNAKDESFTYKGEKLPMSLLKSAIEKLDVFNIIYAINKFKARTNKIKNPEGYMRSLLYRAAYQEDMAITNNVMNDMYGN